MPRNDVPMTVPVDPVPLRIAPLRTLVRCPNLLSASLASTLLKQLRSLRKSLITLRLTPSPSTLSWPICTARPQTCTLLPVRVENASRPIHSPVPVRQPPTLALDIPRPVVVTATFLPCVHSEQKLPTLPPTLLSTQEQTLPTLCRQVPLAPRPSSRPVSLSPP